MKKYNIVLPTHRINFFKELIESINIQTSIPNLVIIIYDKVSKVEIDEVLESIKPKFNYIIYSSIESGFYGSGAIEAFKNCFVAIEKHEEEGYFHIIEDDLKFIRKNSIKSITKELEDCDLLYTKLLSMDYSSKTFLDEYTNNIDNFQQIDTCSLVFNGKFAKKFRDFLSNCGYMLIGDEYLFWYLFNNSKKIKIYPKYLLLSYQHDNQVSSNVDLNLNTNAYTWYKFSKKLNLFKSFTKENYRKLRKETILQYYFPLIFLREKYLAASELAQDFNFKLTKSFIKDLFNLYLTKNYELFANQYKNEILFILNKYNKDVLTKVDFDINPYILKKIND